MPQLRKIVDRNHFCRSAGRGNAGPRDYAVQPLWRQPVRFLDHTRATLRRSEINLDFRIVQIDSDHATSVRSAALHCCAANA